MSPSFSNCLYQRVCESSTQKSGGLFSYTVEYETVMYLHVLLDCKYFAIFLLTTNCVQTMIIVLLTYTMKGCKQLHYAKMHPKVLEFATTNKNGKEYSLLPLGCNSIANSFVGFVSVSATSLLAASQRLCMAVHVSSAICNLKWLIIRNDAFTLHFAAKYGKLHQKHRSQNLCFL